MDLPIIPERLGRTAPEGRSTDFWGFGESFMHVGFLSADLRNDHGAGVYCLNFIEAIRAVGVEATVAVARNSPDILGISVHKILPNCTPREAHFHKRLLLIAPVAWKLLRRCDIVHSLTVSYAPLGTLIAGTKPFFITGYGSYVTTPGRERWPLNWIYKRAFLHSMCMICISRYTRRQAVHVTPNLRVKVINPGINMERFAEKEHRRYHPLTKTVLSVGAIKRRKGQVHLVRAIAKVREKVPAVQCVIVGSFKYGPDYLQEVRQTIEQYNLTDCVHLLGHVSEEDLLNYYRKATVFALPAVNDDWRFEGYGLAYMEASAAGLPVIGTRESGAEDAIQDGKTGYLLSQDGLEDSLADRICELLLDPQKARSMGKAGRQRAKEQMWRRVAEELRSLYEEALRGRG